MTAPRSPWISSEGLSRHYRRAHHVVRAVDGVDLSISRGEFVAIVGASGSGKSTLLNLLAGLDTPTDGHVVADGERLDALSRRALARYRARSVGMIFQSFNLLSHHSALANVEVALYFDDTPRARRRQRAAAALERLGLGDRLGHRPIDLSGGEQQRVAIARALANKQDVVVADEPTGSLDPRTSEEVMDLLLEMCTEEGVTLLLVTHEDEVASRLERRFECRGLVTDTSR